MKGEDRSSYSWVFDAVGVVGLVTIGVGLYGQYPTVAIVYSGIVLAVIGILGSWRW